MVKVILKMVLDSKFYEDGNSYLGGWKDGKKSGFGIKIFQMVVDTKENSETD